MQTEYDNDQHYYLGSSTYSSKYSPLIYKTHHMEAHEIFSFPFLSSRSSLKYHIYTSVFSYYQLHC
jgi:hypothetical protein